MAYARRRKTYKRSRKTYRRKATSTKRYKRRSFSKSGSMIGRFNISDTAFHNMTDVQKDVKILQDAAQTKHYIEMQMAKQLGKPSASGKFKDLEGALKQISQIIQPTAENNGMLYRQLLKVPGKRAVLDRVVRHAQNQVNPPFPGAQAAAGLIA